MKINLRKANKLRKQIEEEVGRSARVAARFRIDIDVDDPSAADRFPGMLESGASTVDEELASAVRLSACLMRLRIAIDRANAVAGICETLAEVAHIDRQIKLMASVAAEHPRKDSEDAIRARIGRTAERLQRMAPNPYESETTTISLAVLDEGRIGAAVQTVRDLRRAREEAEDRRLRVNAAETIEIEESDAMFLRERGIL